MFGDVVGCVTATLAERAASLGDRDIVWPATQFGICIVQPSSTTTTTNSIGSVEYYGRCAVFPAGYFRSSVVNAFVSATTGVIPVCFVEYGRPVF